MAIAVTAASLPVAACGSTTLVSIRILPGSVSVTDLIWPNPTFLGLKYAVPDCGADDAVKDVEEHRREDHGQDQTVESHHPCVPSSGQYFWVPAAASRSWAPSTTTDDSDMPRAVH